MSEEHTAQVPRAVVRPGSSGSWTRVLPVLAFVLAIYLAAQAWGGRGGTLVVRAVDGHGISAGDPLLYRGIAVGEVEDVELSSDLGEVLMRVRVDDAAGAVARAGSRFWVVRPRIGLESVSGLETVLGARHLAVLPGHPDAAFQREFVALEEPPVMAAVEEGLEVLLEAPRRHGLTPGAPISFRGFQVGTIVAVGLSSDATVVEARAKIRDNYRELVRENTAFWEVGGLELSLGVQGLRIDLESLRTFLVGGVALATPTQPGAPARNGHRFRLHAEAEEEWLDWRPALALGSDLLPPGVLPPELLRARTDWKEGFLRRSRSRTGWLLPVAGGVVGPEDLLVPEEDAKEPAVEVDGERLPLSAAAQRKARGLAFRSFSWPEAATWPAERVRELAEAEDCLVVADPTAAPKALDAARLERKNRRWAVDPAISFTGDWHGAAVLARGDGNVVGLLLIDEGRATIAPVSELLED